MGVGVECQVVVAELREERMFPGKTIWGQVQMPSCSLGRASCLQSAGSAVRAAGPGPGVLSTACNAGGMGA